MQSRLRGYLCAHPSFAYVSLLSASQEISDLQRPLDSVSVALVELVPY